MLLRAQQDSAIDINENFIDPIIEQIEITDDLSGQSREDWIEEIVDLTGADSYDLNHLSYEVAVNRLHMTDYQYYQLQLYLELYGDMVSIYELEAVEGFTQQDFQRLRGNIDVAPSVKKLHFFRNFFRRSKSGLWIRYGQTLEKAVGYDRSRAWHYQGSPLHLCFRYSFNTQDRLFVKFSGEKDAGEQFFKGDRRKGFDFYSGSICLKNMGIFKTVVLGDFRLNLGQGLMAGASLLSGKGFDINGVRRFQTAIHAIAPTNEGTFLRGGALSLGKTKITGTLFCAKRVETGGIAFGGDILYRHSLFKIGMRAAGIALNSRNGSLPPYKLFSREDKNMFNFGMDYQVIVKKQLLFGEFSVNKFGKTGILQGAVFTLVPVAKFVVLLRYYNRTFTAPLGRAFGALPKNSGETGCYVAGQYVLGRRCELNIYFDYYRLLWLSYRTDAPATGTDIGLSIRYRIGRNSILTFRYWWKSTEENRNNSFYYKELQTHYRHKVRITLTQQPFDIFRAVTEIQWQLNSYSGMSDSYRGLLLMQDLAFELKKWNTSLHFRIACFDTDRYEERLYACEHDVYYAFTIGSYYYRGVRAYVLLRYRYRWLTLWLRLARTRYFDRPYVGSGHDRINRPHKTDIRLQMMFSF